MAESLKSLPAPAAAGVESECIEYARQGWERGRAGGDKAAIRHIDGEACAAGVDSPAPKPAYGRILINGDSRRLRRPPKTMVKYTWIREIT